MSAVVNAAAVNQQEHGLIVVPVTPSAGPRYGVEFFGGGLKIVAGRYEIAT